MQSKSNTEVKTKIVKRKGLPQKTDIKIETENKKNVTIKSRIVRRG